MADFVFVNPSPNMDLLVKAAGNAGRTVEVVYTNDYIDKKAGDLWAFIGGKNYCLSDRALSDTETGIANLKKPFFAALKKRGINEKLSNLNPILKSGFFQDLVLLKSTLWTNNAAPNIETRLSFEEILSKYSSSIIVTSSVPSASGKYALCRWRTDYDVREALADDYFFLFDSANRYELFCMDNELWTIANTRMNISKLKELNPALGRFAFELISRHNFNQNRNSWIERQSNICLINDYTWQGFSAKLPESWEKAMLKTISGMLKKKS